MIYWTIQSRIVLDILNCNGYYEPDFSKSSYLERYKNNNSEYDLYTPNMNLYYTLLSFANQINNVNLKGLIFSFCKFERNHIIGFPNYKAFRYYISEKKNVIKSLWNILSQTDSVILELEFNKPYWNPLFIDINDYQYLMPPVIPWPPYSQDSEQKIYNNLSRGICCKSPLPSGICQAHLPYINFEMIRNIYDVFSI